MPHRHGQQQPRQPARAPLSTTVSGRVTDSCHPPWLRLGPWKKLAQQIAHERYPGKHFWKGISLLARKLPRSQVNPGTAASSPVLKRGKKTPLPSIPSPLCLLKGTWRQGPQLWHSPTEVPSSPWGRQTQRPQPPRGVGPGGTQTSQRLGEGIPPPGMTALTEPQPCCQQG